MSAFTHLTSKTDFADQKWAPDTTITTEIGPNQLLLHLDRFTLTSNNVTYCALGDNPRLRYWSYFDPPASLADNTKFGRVPIWGVSVVIKSTVAGVEPGTRIFGYYPIATFSILTVERSQTVPDQLIEVSEHRKPLISFYQQYRILRQEKWQKHETYYLMLFIGYITGYLVTSRWLLAEKAKGKKVLILGASSKTAVCTAACITKQLNIPVIGFSSSGAGADFAHGTGFYDAILPYSSISPEDPVISGIKEEVIVIDLKGDSAWIDRFENIFGEKMVDVIKVGATDWRKPRTEHPRSRQFAVMGELVAQIEDEGEKAFTERFEKDFLEFLEFGVPGLVAMQFRGQENVVRQFRRLLEGAIDPTRCLIHSL